MADDNIDFSTIMRKDESAPKKEPAKNVKSISFEEDFTRELAVDKKKTGPNLAPQKNKARAKKSAKVDGDEAIARRRLILTIQMHFNEFGKELAAFKKGSLESLTIEELTEKLREMQFHLGSKNNIDYATKGIMEGLKLLEYICVEYTPLKVQGLHNALKDDEDTIKDIKLLCLKHISLIETGPEQRIGFTLVKTMATLHTLNEANENNQIPSNRNGAVTSRRGVAVNDRPDNIAPTINEINEQFSDL